MSEQEKHINNLGFKCKDKVTGFSGVITSICFDLFGCVQYCVSPGVSSTGETRESFWVDSSRLTIKQKKRVMTLPDFSHGPVAEGKKGPTNKQGMRAL